MKAFYIILAILLVIMVILVGIVINNSMFFNKKIEAEVTDLLRHSKGGIYSAPTIPITENDLSRLPEPVQRYLRYSQVMGKTKINTVRLTQYGSFQPKQDGKWIPFEAEQHYTVNPPAFLWSARMKPNLFSWVAGRDLYSDGKGSMLIKLYSTVTVVDGKGPEFDQGEMIRYMSEIVWFPTAWLSDYLKWESIDSTSAKVTMTYSGVSATAVVYFNSKGELVNFTADRYMAVGNTTKLAKWSTPTAEDAYKEMNGFRIPTSGEAVWKLPEGDYPYVRLDVISIEYNF